MRDPKGEEKRKKYMRESEPNPENKEKSALSGEFSDLTDPRAYLKVAKRGMGQLRELFGVVENKHGR